MSSPPLSSTRNPYLRANSLAELMSWHDVDFVRCAFVTILGRQPDPEGETHFADRIRSGQSKLKVLWDLRRSPEGAGHDPGISGLDHALKIAALRRNRWFGGIARIFYRGEGTSTVDQGIRQIQNALAVIHDEQVRQTSTLATVAERTKNVALQSSLILSRDNELLRGRTMSPDGSMNSSEETAALAGPDADLSSREQLALSIIRKKRAD